MPPYIFPAFPDGAEFDIYATMQPAKEVGGTLYGNAKTLIKNNAQAGKSPKGVFETVNNTLCENNEAGMFVTAFMWYLDIPTSKFTYVNTGHNPPLLRSGRRFDWLKTKPGFVLAGMEDMCYVQNEIILNPGDELFLYTDGVTDAMNNKHNLFSDRRLLEDTSKYKHCSIEDLFRLVKNEIDHFAGGVEQADDITMLALEIKQNHI